MLPGNRRSGWIVAVADTEIITCMTSATTLEIRRAECALTVVARETTQLHSVLVMFSYRRFCHFRARRIAFDLVTIAAVLQTSNRMRRVAKVDPIGLKT